MSRRTPTMAQRTKKPKIDCMDCRALALRVNALEKRVAALEERSGLTAVDRAVLANRRMQRGLHPKTPMQLLSEETGSAAETEGER